MIETASNQTASQEITVLSVDDEMVRTHGRFAEKLAVISAEKQEHVDRIAFLEMTEDALKRALYAIEAYETQGDPHV